jgi:glycosyltransferase domain-containing protein
VVILDASIKKAFHQSRSNIEYHHLPNSSYHSRLEFLSQVVKTKYMVLQADDDFHGIRGLGACVTFLEKNTDYSCAQGRYLRFYSRNTYHWATDYDYQNSLLIDSNNPETRINQFFDSGMHFIYAVMPSRVFLEIVQIIKRISHENLMLSELVFNFTMGCFGKYKTIPVFYSARGMDLRPENTKPSSFASWKLSEATKDYELFLEAISVFYTQYLNCDLDSAKMLTLELINRSELARSHNQSIRMNAFLSMPAKSLLVLETLESFLKRSSLLYSLSKYCKKSVWRFFWNLTTKSNFISFLLDFRQIKRVKREFNKDY